ncbi:hypothetical protein, partial [Stenotrophomonas rhizophila]|uniref:hypothetical protein n=1 Tax=Stenotrophomonas rhizophila TaxID=216778 RepID=UPI001E40CE57
LDSRAVRPGNAFVAIAGFGAHGLGFGPAPRTSVQRHEEPASGRHYRVRGGRQLFYALFTLGRGPWRGPFMPVKQTMAA